MSWMHSEKTIWPIFPWKNGRHFGRRQFQIHFLKINMVEFRFEFHRNVFLPRSTIDNNPVLGQVMAWHRTGDKPLTELMLTQLTDMRL